MSYRTSYCPKCGRCMSYEKCAGMILANCKNCKITRVVEDTWKKTSKDMNTENPANTLDACITLHTPAKVAVE